MAWLKRLADLFGGRTSEQASGYFFAVKCSRCGEVLHARVDLANELSAEYEEAEAPARFVCRKVLMGQQRCFQQIQVTLTFDEGRRLADRQISGGDFVD